MRDRVHASAKDGKKTGDRTGVGFFVPLPANLANHFPSLGSEDSSPPHITFLYVGEVPADQESRLLDAASRVFQFIKEPIRAHIQGLGYFDHPGKGRRVAVVTWRFDQDMADLRWRLRDALQEAGFPVDDSFPLVFRPHTTLAYMEGLDAHYEGLVPEGDFFFDRIEVWGLPTVPKVQFGQDPAARLAARWLGEHDAVAKTAAANRGKKRSEETRAKMREARLAYWARVRAAGGS